MNKNGNDYHMVVMNDEDDHDTRDQTYLYFPAMMSHNWLHTPNCQVQNKANETLILLLLLSLLTLLLLLLSSLLLSLSLLLLLSPSSFFSLHIIIIIIIIIITSGAR